MTTPVRLSPIDASFLHQERRASHMHIGGVLIFEGPAPDYEDLVAHILDRMRSLPRYRQRLVAPPLGLGRPFWADDPDFNIRYHVRHTALPPPGSEEQLRLLVGRIFSQRLDRSRPLWEAWLVEGLAGGRFALVSKTHHSVIDGVSGVDIATVLFDSDPLPARPRRPAPPLDPKRIGPLDLVGETVAGALRTPIELAGGALRSLQRPSESVRRLRDALEGVGEVAWATLNPAPDTPLNVRIGPHRRIVWVEATLDDFRLVKRQFGGTVNDVVLAAVSGALGRWLRRRGVATEGLELRALVPVSVRGEDEHGTLGNRIVAMRGPLPVYAWEPVERMRVVSEAMAHLKQSKQALGAGVIASLERFAPPTLLALASRLNFSTRLFNLIVTNVPGPQVPLYLLGREMLACIPVAFLPENHALAVAVMSYNGHLRFGLLGDWDAMFDLELLADDLEASIEELVSAARARERSARARAGAERGGNGAVSMRHRTRARSARSR
ncbi:WS/DGAT/MGAT family O-acyltransferase [Thermoleophilum album]|uniref:WS/DGAT/MGAT family O-acyltransferase n=1 Tax=Thermoleophilum album TaxID=29539 RepID=UPI001C409A20|nr:wax ester/triacylglycerol synthase family O-acyltransferase [Thermoleophilum album]